jgi:hypothetical protein
VNIDDLVLVSVDDHVVEPPTMFDDHLPALSLIHITDPTRLALISYAVFFL